MTAFPSRSAVPRRQAGAAAAGGAAGRPLAIYTEIASTLSQTKKIQVDDSGVIQDGSEARLLRWELQAAARKLLGREHRIGVCHRIQAPVREDEPEGVRVYRRADSDSTYYRGLMVCGNGWVCPVCAAKIAERRRAELDAAIRDHLARGGGVYHMLLTVPHSRADQCGAVVDDLLAAFRNLCSGRSRLSEMVPKYMGFVRALEVTHGDNGWHPHLHVLVFTRSPLAADLVESTRAKIWERWQAKVLRRFGSLPSERAFSFAGAVTGCYEEQHIKLVQGEYVHVCPVTGYVTKFGADVELVEIVRRRRWGAADELTKNTVKRGGRGGRTPWQLLADYSAGADLDDPVLSQYAKQSGALWADFAAAFKGKQQLGWSRGLRAELGLTDEAATDEELAAVVDAEDIMLGRITDTDWALIVRHQLRGLVLEVLRAGTWADLDLLLSRFRKERKDGS